MPSTISTSVSSDLASSTVMTPSLPTFCMASAIILPILLSPFDEDGADLGDLGRGADLLGALLDVLDHRRNRDLDAALQVHRVHAGGRPTWRPSRTIAWRQHGRRGWCRRRPGRWSSAPPSRTICAPHVLEFVLELDLLGHRHAVLGDPRRAEALVDDDVAALGPERHPAPHWPGHRCRAASGSRASDENLTSFAAISFNSV